MKLDARRVSAFLRDPGACRAVLLFGEDAGLIRERAEPLVRAVAGSLEDPFRVTVLSSRQDLDRLSEEAAALSLVGGRRVVWARQATDSLTEALRSVLGRRGDALIVLEGATLEGRSKPRRLLEGAP